ncbi:hypothetical protein SAMN05445756_1697 [Kytococcus aerolatus]|uniref:TadE-like domain-containing protein n=1 Tax=Kytococcus aerolatus TaxID=592308 RepID=A0A212U191_9MICO|nr:TadE/TadG family type IV pilus assembly protein [Kytococcus aerolatus]SNC72025.1 hypothetical protein SAMN05445756_1697 [Kytococcus aerolatus]
MTAEFVLTSTVAVFTVLALLQLAFALHVRNSLTAYAVEGARYGAREGAAPQAGVTRAQELTRGAVAGRAVDEVTEHRAAAAGREVVVVEITADLPLLGPWGPVDALTIQGRAMVEGP